MKNERLYRKLLAIAVPSEVAKSVANRLPARTANALADSLQSAAIKVEAIGVITRGESPFATNARGVQ